MTLTAEQIAKDLAAAEARRDTFLAELNGVIGQITYMKHLLAEAEKPEPDAPKDDAPA